MKRRQAIQQWWTKLLANAKTQVQATTITVLIQAKTAGTTAINNINSRPESKAIAAIEAAEQAKRQDLLGRND